MSRDQQTVTGSSSERDEENIYAPMSNATVTEVKEPKNIAPLLITLVSTLGVLTLAFYIIVQKLYIDDAVMRVLPGLVAGLVTALIPPASLTRWMNKYWDLGRLFLFINAVAWLLPVRIPMIPSYSLLGYFSITMGLSMVVEWRYRRRNSQ